MPKKVFLQDQKLVAKSRHHRSYAGDGAVNEGKGSQLYVLEFYNGVARDVPDGTYQRFKDLGHCDTKRPFTDEDD
jgi:hypothetical protein